MAANASRSRGLFGRIGGFFGGGLRGAKRAVVGAGSGIKGAYVGVGRAFTGGAVQNTVYNNKTKSKVRNERNMNKVILPALNKLLMQRGIKGNSGIGSGIITEIKFRKKKTLTEFINSLNMNKNFPRNGGRRNTPLNSLNPTLDHYAEEAYMNYLKRKANARKKNNAARKNSNTQLASITAKRNKNRKNDFLRSLENLVINNHRPNYKNGNTVETKLSENNRNDILNALNAKNAYSQYVTSTTRPNKPGATSLKGFVAYLNTGRNVSLPARNLSKLSLLENAIKNAITNKKSRNNAKTASNANRLKKQQEMRNARRARLKGTPSPPPPPPAETSAGGAVLSAEVANHAAGNAVKIATKNPTPTNNNKAVVAVNAARVANRAAESAVNAARSGNAKLAKQNEMRAGQAAFVARSVAPPTTTQMRGPNNRRVPGKSGAGAGAASGFLQGVFGG
jgi:hypothetical protein